MAPPAIELQRAVFSALSGDSALRALLGGRKVYDHAPSDVAFPYITFGRTSIYDWSTGTESGTEQLFTLHAWSKAKGKKEVADIMEAARALLHDQSLAMDAHALVNCRHEFSEARYDDDLAVYHGVLRFRAVTEPI